MLTNDRISDAVLTALRQIMRAIDIHSRNLLRQCGVTGPQLSLMRIVESNSGLTQSALASRLSLSSATVTGIVDRLERQGLVERSRNGVDRRQITVGISELGQKVLDTAPPLLQENFLSRFGQLPEAERAEILASLEAVSQMMNADHLDVAPLLSAQPLNGNEELPAGDQQSRKDV
ncbi:MAG: MarR family winged helix-turn-helix transcriptional regulator [bacterium]